MIGFVARRLIAGAGVLWVVATLTFALLRFLPGGPFDKEKTLPPEILRNLERRYALDGTVAEQYFDYLGRVLKGDLGPSYKYPGRDVREILFDALPVSVELGLLALAIAIAGGIALGLAAGTRRGTALDRSVAWLSLVGVSAPSFVIGAGLILVVGLWLDWLPAGLWEGPRHAILPALTLAALPLAYVTQLTRAQVVAVMGQDFVRTARAKGVPESRLRRLHVLRNALLAVSTYFGPLLATLLTGSFVVEKIYAIPGMGRFFVTAVTNRDYPLVLGVTLVYAVLVVLANLAVDLLYAWLDPRIRVSGDDG
ncbi:MAG: ABC transporter permease [Deltaproteobacteria bacterium]|nr:ABC transporter permease [Deltaproteobacteria bacterium]